MKILILTPYDPTIACGNNIASLRLRENFERQGHEVCLIGNCTNITRSAARSKAFSFSPDVVLVMHGWRCREAFFGIESLSISPIVVSLRGTDVNEMLADKRKLQTISTILHRSEGTTVFNTGMFESLLRRLPISPAKVHVIPNGLSMPPPDGDYRAKLGLSATAPVIAGLAGIRPVKGMLHLTTLLKKLKADFPDLLYLHAGPIIDRKEGELFLSICRKEPWMIYTGEIPHEDVTSFLKAGNIFVSASSSEGMPHGVREAMLAGIPCLLSSIDGHHNMASDGQEALFFHNERSFFDGAQQLLCNDGLRKKLAGRARDRITAECSNGDESGRYLRLFTGLIEDWKTRIRKGEIAEKEQ